VTTTHKRCLYGHESPGEFHRHGTGSESCKECITMDTNHKVCHEICCYWSQHSHLLLVLFILG